MGFTTASEATLVAVVDDAVVVVVDWKRDLIRFKVCVDRRIVLEEDVEI